jgi:very-short-patch-repair endonuclease
VEQAVVSGAVGYKIVKTSKELEVFEKKKLLRYQKYFAGESIEQKWQKECFEFYILTGNRDGIIALADEIESQGRVKTIQRQLWYYNDAVQSARRGDSDTKAQFQPETLVCPATRLRIYPIEKEMFDSFSGAYAIVDLNCSTNGFEAEWNEAIYGIDIIRKYFTSEFYRKKQTLGENLSSKEKKLKSFKVRLDTLRVEVQTSFQADLKVSFETINSSFKSIYENRRYLIEKYAQQDSVDFHWHPIVFYMCEKTLRFTSSMHISLHHDAKAAVEDYVSKYPYKYLAPRPSISNSWRPAIPIHKLRAILFSEDASVDTGNPRKSAQPSLFTRFDRAANIALRNELELKSFSSEKMASCIEFVKATLFNGLTTGWLEPENVELPRFLHDRGWSGHQPEPGIVDVKVSNYRQNPRCRALCAAYIEGVQMEEFRNLLVWAVQNFSLKKQQRDLEKGLEIRDKLWKILRSPIYNPKYFLGSNGEVWLHRLLQKKFSDQFIIKEFSPWFLGSLRLDFGFPNLKAAIEFDGQQHGVHTALFGGLDGTIKRHISDHSKDEALESFGWKLLRVAQANEIEEEKVVNFIQGRITQLSFR